MTLVVEVTWKPRSGDVEHQAARLGVLSRHVGPVAAVVVAVEPPPGRLPALPLRRRRACGHGGLEPPRGNLSPYYSPMPTAGPGGAPSSRRVPTVLGTKASPKRAPIACWARHPVQCAGTTTSGSRAARSSRT